MGTLPGKRARGRPKTSWMNNITAWTGITVNEISRKTENKMMASCHLACGQPLDRGRLKKEEEFIQFGPWSFRSVDLYLKEYSLANRRVIA